MTIYAGAIAPNVDKNAFDNVVGMAYKGLTYCTGEAKGKSMYAEFGEKLKAHSPSTVGKVSVGLASEYYDAVKPQQSWISKPRSRYPTALHQSRWRR